MRARPATLVMMALAAGLAACTIVDEGMDEGVGEGVGEGESLDEDQDIDQVSAELTAPISGAVAKPSSFAIGLPWADGLKRKIIRGYGTGHHQNVNSTTNSNDYYALDFEMWFDETVHPVANGKVVYAGFASGNWTPYGRIVFIDHENGYQSLYAHLNSVEVAAGTPVTVWTRLGGAGDSGPTSPVHLHFALYKNARFQNIPGATGPYGGQAVVPEAFSWCVKGGGSCENLLYADQLTKRVTTGCPYQSVQSRVHRDMNKDWTQTLSILQDKTFQVAAFRDGLGQLTTNFTNIVVTRPDGVLFRPPNLGIIVPSMVGRYSVRATCGSLTETATVDVLATTCPYGSIQARVHRDITQDWASKISITLGESFEVAAFHDGLGQLAADSTTAINVIGPKAFTVFKQNLATITPAERGTYRVRAACGGLAEEAVVDVN